MLVLTRKSGQKIMIGKNISITVLKVQGDQVSIGIEAPESYRILREEIYEAIADANVGGAINENIKKKVDVKNVAKSLKGSFKGKSKQTQKLPKLQNFAKNKNK